MPCFKGLPQLPIFLSKEYVPFGFSLDAKHQESKLAILDNWAEDEEPTLAIFFLPRSIALSTEGGNALASLRLSWQEQLPQRIASKTVISLLCRLAGGLEKLKGKSPEQGQVLKSPKSHSLCSLKHAKNVSKCDLEHPPWNFL